MSYNDTYQREFEASPIFNWANANAISDSNPINVAWENYDSNSMKYLPFDFMTISNQGEDDIYLYPNQNLSNPILINKNTIKTIDKSTVAGWSGFAIKRAGSTTISANKIFVNQSKIGQTADTILSRIHKKWFGQPNFVRF